MGVAGYGVYVNGSRVESITATSYGFGGLSCGASYALEVDAYDAAGNRSAKASYTGSTSACAATTGTQINFRFAYSNVADQSLMPTYGYNLIDVSSVGEADAVPSGTKAQVWLYDYDNTTCSWEKDDTYIKNIVSQLANDPKVAGFYFSNEPDPFACPTAPQQHKQRNAMIKSLAPNKYTLIGIDANWREHFDAYGSMWVGTADYVNYNPYVCYVGRSTCDFAWLDHVLATAQSLPQRYFVALQAFAEGNEWRWPTAAEETQMLNRLKNSSLTGLRGYMTFSWNWQNDPLLHHPDVLQAIKTFNLGVGTTGATAGDPVVAAAGDICSTATDCAPTANLLDTIAPTRVLTLGDNAYPDGTFADYSSFYDPNWGRFKGITSPAPGNHDYHTAAGAGYFAYFGSQAPAAYYSFEVGSWHLISLNGEVDHAAGSVQETWLKDDLAAHPTRCTLAYWHEPRFSSGSEHGSDPTFSPFWRDLYAARADVVLNGHDHEYERFAPQNPSGTADADGIREWVVGTGGASHYSFGTPIANSEVRDNTSFGVLTLTLHSASYDWQFVPIAGASFTDSGSTSCH